MKRAKLGASIEVPVDYPVRAPHFALSYVKHPGSREEDKRRRANANTNVLREMEMLANALYPEPDAADDRRLLTAQVAALLTCTSVHAATLTTAAACTPTLFCERGARGRDRRCAMRFDEQAQQFTSAQQFNT